MSVDREVVVASLSVLTISILKRTLSMRYEICVAYQTSIPPVYRVRYIRDERAGEGCFFHNILSPIQPRVYIHLTQP